MKNPRFNLMAIAAVIIAIIVFTGCRHCPTCPPVASNPCDTCYCPEPGKLEPDGNWCCSDRLTKPCVPDTMRGCTKKTIPSDYNNADIRIDKLEMRIVGDNVETDIEISNNGDDTAPCAKLEVLLPVATKFIAFNNSGTIPITWEFYGGYLRVNLGHLEVITNPDPQKSHRYVKVITSFNCFKQAVNSGMGAFVYSIAPDPCLANNYAYGYYQKADPSPTGADGLSGCIPPKIVPLVKE
jgi:hypothetical protein